MAVVLVYMREGKDLYKLYGYGYGYVYDAVLEQQKIEP